MSRRVKRIFLTFGLLISLSGVFAQAKPKSNEYSFSNLPKIKPVAFKKDTFNILRYGAKPDGFTLNTRSINTAIAECSKKGGGVVLIPAGLWISGPIVLKSNVNLHLQRGSLLQFTDDFSQYPLVAANWEGLPQMRNQSPISATGQQNIAITGSGIIDGNGDAWRQVKKDKLTESQWKKVIASGGILSPDQKTWYPSEQSLKASALKNPGAISPEKTPEFYDSIKDFLRPNLLLLTSCKTILIQGVTFQNSPAWCLHPLLCEDLTVRNIFVKNPWYAQNGDGIDVESCKNVLIEGSIFDVGDDALCMKSGRDAEGRKRGIPTENVIVRNNTVYHAHGGFVIGSEMSGGARNIFVSNCSFIGTDIGLRFKTTRGRGGLVEKIFIKDIVMKDIPAEAILFDMYYMAQDPVVLSGEKRDAPIVQLVPVTEETPVFRNFHISNVVCNGAAKGIFIRGLPEMKISGIHLENIKIKAVKGIELQDARGITFKNVSVISQQTNPIVSLRDVTDLTFDNIGHAANAELLFKVNGTQNENIRTMNSAPLSEQMVATVMDIWKDSLFMTPGKSVKWPYDQGVVLEGIYGLWKRTNNVHYFNYIQKSMDFYVEKDGTIRTYKQDDYNIDNIKNGRVLLTLYKETGQEKYLKAAAHLWEQLKKQPRTLEGGFWHKKIYPYQMWLDGLYMGEPFYAEYAALVKEHKAYDDIANQFIFMEKHARDPKNGLLYHGWDESREQQWADKTTGNSPNFWARAMGWYAMGLVDVLDNFPANHPKRKELLAILNRLVVAVKSVQDAKSGLWYDILDKPEGKGNYFESSASCMFVYAIAKGVRSGYLPETYMSMASRGYEGIKKEFAEQREPGKINLKGTVSVSGLGGNPYRDGSYEYYMREKVISNDPKGVGSFLLASNEMELYAVSKNNQAK